MPRSLLGPAMPAILATAAILAGAIFAALSIGGIPFATAVALLVITLGILVAISDRGTIPRKLARPGRDEIVALVAEAGVLAASAVVAISTVGWGWVVVPVLGSAAVYLVYAYSRPKNAVPAGSLASPTAGSLRSSEIAELAETLGTVDIFSGLPASGLTALAELGEVRTHKGGEILCTEGQPGSSLYVVLDGRANLSVDSPDGPLNVRIAGPGESFPLVALLGDGRQVTTATASTAMKMWQVDRIALRSHFQAYPSVGAHVYGKAAAVLAERYRSTLWKLTEATSEVVGREGFWANV